MVLKLDPPAAPAQRRVAWTVVAHTAFDKGAFADAEKGYVEVLALTPDKDAKRNELVERLAASVYKQGEQARAAGDLRRGRGPLRPGGGGGTDLEHPRQRAVRRCRRADRAQGLGRRDRARWKRSAAATPTTRWQAEVGPKLALAYMEKGQGAQAAVEFERLGRDHQGSQAARNRRCGRPPSCTRRADRAPLRPGPTSATLKLYPDSLETGIEVRYRLAQMAKADGNARANLR